MAKQAVNLAMEQAVRAWLERKGISPDEVLTNYSVKHTDGMTYLTITLIAQDFPLPAEPVSRETNRPHPTCIDVTRADERPYSSWVCGPDCPPMSCAFHTDCREATSDQAHMPNNETECANGCAPGQHHWPSCLGPK